MTIVNRRGLYYGPTHPAERGQDWSFMARWQPSVIRLMLPGSHTDPSSVSIHMIHRVHDTSPESLILLRVWDVDDRNGEAKRAMAADPEGFADTYHDWWRGLFARMPRELADTCMAGSVNEPWPDQFGALKPFSRRVCRSGTRDGIRYGVLCFSTGTPPLAGEAPHDWPWFADLEPDIVAGNHAAVLHEYMQPEGMRGEWTDQQGRTRRDYENLISRHHHCPYTEADIIIGEWGIEGLLYNRHPDPEHGHAGWLHFPDLWPPERYADEYIACVQDASPNVIAICPFISDYNDDTWRTADLAPAYDEFLARKHLALANVDAGAGQHKTHLPNVQTDNPEPTAQQPTEPIPAGIVDPVTALAFLEVESGNQPFMDGLLTIRVEIHRLQVHLQDDALFDRYFKFTPGNYGEQYWRPAQDAPWQHAHGSMRERHKLLNFARSLNDTAALLSTGMGMAQIMGANHARVGFPSPQTMFRAFSITQFGANAQLVAFFNYLLSDPVLMQALRQRDWWTAVQKYNGIGQEELYIGLLEQARARIAGQIGM